MKPSFKAIIYTLVVLFIVGVLAFVVAKPARSKTTSTKQPSVAYKAPPSTTATTPVKTPTPTKPAPNPSPGSTSPTQTGGSSQLSNSGPGDVVLLYAGVVVVSAFGYHLLQRRQL
jgi:hypothetical protein